MGAGRSFTPSRTRFGTARVGGSQTRRASSLAPPPRMKRRSRPHGCWDRRRPPAPQAMSVWLRQSRLQDADTLGGASPQRTLGAKPHIRADIGPAALIGSGGAGTTRPWPCFELDRINPSSAPQGRRTARGVRIRAVVGGSRGLGSAGTMTVAGRDGDRDGGDLRLGRALSSIVGRWAGGRFPSEATWLVAESSRADEC